MGGVLIIHIDDLRRLAPFWLHKTEEVRADKAHWATNITGDMYQQGWISEMYGYAFGAAEVNALLCVLQVLLGVMYRNVPFITIVQPVSSCFD